MPAPPGPTGPGWTRRAAGSAVLLFFVLSGGLWLASVFSWQLGNRSSSWPSSRSPRSSPSSGSRSGSELVRFGPSRFGRSRRASPARCSKPFVTGTRRQRPRPMSATGDSFEGAIPSCGSRNPSALSASFGRRSMRRRRFCCSLGRTTASRWIGFEPRSERVSCRRDEIFIRQCPPMVGEPLNARFASPPSSPSKPGGHPAPPRG